MTVYQRHIAEDVLEDRRLGRHVHHDPQSREHPADQAPKIVSVAHLAKGLPLNQGSVGSCTGEALTAAGNAQPNLTVGPPRTQHDAYVIYHDETVLEGQPWPPNDPGGSGLMVCKAARHRGWLKSYHHAFGLQHALTALVLRPAIFGVDWFDSFDTPDKNGLIEIKPNASIRGGHEICALEIDAGNELVWFAQSWGLQYGVARPEIGLSKGGAFCMTFDTVGKLLSQQGDCTVPVFA